MSDSSSSSNPRHHDGRTRRSSATVSSNPRGVDGKAIVLYSRKTPIPREEKLSNRVIILTQQDPIKRLKELCKKGLYKYRFTWDIFANGIMCECLLYISKYGSKKIEVSKSARFVLTSDLEHAKKVAAAILLESLGLGSNADECSKNELLDVTAEDALKVYEDSLSDDELGKPSEEDVAMEDAHHLARRAMQFANNMIAHHLPNIEGGEQLGTQLTDQLHNLTQQLALTQLHSE